jgi:hypothetical protein
MYAIGCYVSSPSSGSFAQTDSFVAAGIVAVLSLVVHIISIGTDTQIALSVVQFVSVAMIDLFIVRTLHDEFVQLYVFSGRSVVLDDVAFPVYMPSSDDVTHIFRVDDNFSFSEIDKCDFGMFVSSVSDVVWGKKVLMIAQVFVRTVFYFLVGCRVANSDLGFLPASTVAKAVHPTNLIAVVAEAWRGYTGLAGCHSRSFQAMKVLSDALTSDTPIIHHLCLEVG